MSVIEFEDNEVSEIKLHEVGSPEHDFLLEEKKKDSIVRRWSEFIFDVLRSSLSRKKRDDFDMNSVKMATITVESTIG